MKVLMRSESHFNSQPHEEADLAQSYRSSGERISTHSLTKRLTQPKWICWDKKDISTHSLTKRLTFSIYTIFPEIVISTHSLTKRLTLPCPEKYLSGTISTHSLTKRLTNPVVPAVQLHGYFNSQPHEEADEFQYYFY